MQYGYNEVPEEKERPVLRFLKKFWGVSAWMLELIIILSAVLHKYADLAVVGGLLVVNAVLSFAQDRRAAGVVAALRRRLQVSARVRRDAAWQVITARELVPGDIVRVRPGDIIPADVKVLSGTLSVDQSALTGESLDVDKKTGDVLSSGSVVRRGEGNGVVMLTGAQTYFGRTTELVQRARPKLHIEAVVAKLVRWLFVIVGALLGMVLVVSLFGEAPLIEVLPLLLVLADERSARRFAGNVHGQHGRRGRRAGQAWRPGHAAQRRRRCRHDGRAVRRQDGDDHDESTGRHRRDPAGKRDRGRRAAGRCAGFAGGQPGSDRPGVPRRRDESVTFSTRLPAVTPVSFKPFDPATRRTEAVIEQNGQRFAGDERCRAAVAQACGAVRRCRSTSWRPASPSRLSRGIARWRWPAARRRPVPNCSGW